MQISISNIVKGSFISNAFIAISRYFTRVTNDGGIYEKPLCVEAGINSSPLFQQASFLFLPSGYKGGVAYSELPANGSGDLSWVRGSDAWRTNAEGLVQRVPWNLLQQSETFELLWNKTRVNVTANSTTAPNGTLTADRISLDNSGTNSYSINQQSSVLTSSLTFTFSLYVKYETRQFIQLVWGTAFSTNEYANFDLINGTVTAGTYSSASIVASSNGFYRISITTTGTSTTPFCYIWPVDSGTAARAAACNGVGSYFIWGAQLAEGSSAQTYFPTTDRLNVPRLSYMYGSCPALLLEPQRTNLCLYSAQLDDATWSKLNSSVTANSTTSPDGTTNADKIVENNTTAFHGIVQSITTIVSTYAISFYAKASERSFIQWNNQAGAEYINFDLTNGAVGSSSGVTNASITSVGNGWYRCSFNYASTTVATTGFMRLVIVTSATSARLENYLGNGTSGLFVWGCQFELGAYATTYIPTTTASATRIADSFSRNNIYTNGLITSSGGTWFVELRGNLSLTRDSSDVGLFVGNSSNGTSGDVLAIRNNGTGRLAITKRISGTQTGLYETTTNTTKIAIKWNGSTADVFVNGTKQVSATSFTATNMEFFNGSGADVTKYIPWMTLYSTPLSDAECAFITTL